MSTITTATGGDDDDDKSRAANRRRVLSDSATQLRIERRPAVRRSRKPSLDTTSLIMAILTLLALGTAGVSSIISGLSKDDRAAFQASAPWILLGVALLACGAAIPWFITRREYMKNENKRFGLKLKAQEEYEREVLEKLKKETELATLMGLNQGQIDRYHEIVTEQADKAFKSSRLAMGIGLFLLVCAAVAGAFVPVEQVRWFIGALAAFSTVLSGYLTKTYLALYKESIGQLNRYFDQPVLNSHYLTAERLAECLEGEAAIEVRRQIINEVLASSSKVGAKTDDPAPKASLNGGKPKKRRLPKQRAAPESQQA